MKTRKPRDDRRLSKAISDWLHRLHGAQPQHDESDADFKKRLLSQPPEEASTPAPSEGSTENQ